MKNLEKMLRLGLQFFAEGTGEGNGADGEGAAESSTGPSDEDMFMARMEQKYGITNGVASAQAMELARSEESVARSQKAEEKSADSGADNGAEKAETAEAEPNVEQKSPEEEFDELIKSDKFKGAYGKKVAAALSERFKNQTDATAEAEKYKSAISQLAGRYGKNADDIEGIIAAISADDELLEGEALETGKSVEALRSEKRIRAEKEASKKEIEDLKAKVTAYENREKATADAHRWMQEAKSTVEIYKDFDLRTELTNPNFLKYLQRDGMSVTEAYEHAHMKEIMASQLKAVERRAEEIAAAAVRANLGRVREGAYNARRSNDAPRIDVRNMKDEDFAKIEEMLANGEDVTLEHLR